MNINKDEIIKHLSGLDVSILEKLYNYSKFLLIPEQDLLVNATMSQMVNKAHQLADSLFPEWTDRSKSDFGEYLVELFALFSEKDFWYINAFANEGLLPKMRSYSNVFSKAISMGYTPKTCRGASCEFTVVFKEGESTFYNVGDLLVDVEGVTFMNPEPFRVQRSSLDTTMTLKLVEGESFMEDFSFNGYNVFLSKENIDLTSIRVFVGNILYTRVPTFGLSGADSTHYVILPEDNGSCSIYFGSNGIGVQPPLGSSVRVEFRTCKGEVGNLPITSATVSNDLPNRPAKVVLMNNESSGGSNPESMKSIKEKAPLFFNTKRAALNETMAVSILKSFPFVHKAFVKVVGRDVNYSIIPTSGDKEPSEKELEIISKEFHPYIMAGFRGRYTKNEYKNLMGVADLPLIVDAIIHPNYNSESIEQSIRQFIMDVTNPLVLAEYGGDFKKGEMELLMRAKISGIQSVQFKIQNDGSETLISDVELEDGQIFTPIKSNRIIVRTHVL